MAGTVISLAKLKSITSAMDELVHECAELGWAVDIRVTPAAATMLLPKIAPAAATMLLPKQSVATRELFEKSKVKESVGASVLRLIQAKVDAGGTCDKEQVYKDGIRSGMSRQQIGQRLRSLRESGHIKVSEKKIFLVR